MPLGLYVTRIGNDVGIGEDAVGVDEYAGAGCLPGVEQAPGNEVVGGGLGGMNLDDGVFDFPDVGVLRGHGAAGQQQEAGDGA